MTGHVRNRGTSSKPKWVYVISLGEQRARRCVRVDEEGKRTCKGVCNWHDDSKQLDACPKCGGPLREEKLWRQKWSKVYPRKEDAEKALRASLGLVDKGADPFPSDIKLRTFVQEKYLPHVKTQGRIRERTWIEYEKLLDRWVLPNYGGLALRTFGVRHAQGVLDAVTAAGKSPSTVRNVRSALSAIFTLAVKLGIVDVNPVHAAEAPTATRPDLRVPTAPEIRQLIATAEGGRWAIPTLIAGVSGARRAEVLGVRWANVDLDAGRVRIVETIQRLSDKTLGFMPPKTKSSVRTVRIPAFAVARLRRHRIEQRERRLRLGSTWTDLDLVCDRGDGQPMSPAAFTAGFLALAAKAGFEGVRLHDLRHGVATALAKSGTSALATSKLLGHSSVAFTSNVYQHADDEMVDIAAAALEAVLVE